MLEQMGISFQIRPAVGEEIITCSEPSEVVMELAGQKAQEIADRILTEMDKNNRPSLPGLLTGRKPGHYLIVGADTIVAYEGSILGKPKDERDAVRMLTMLSGHTHQVYTGVCLLYVDDERTESHVFYEKTDVTMYRMSAGEIAAYVRTGEPMDKAGAYGIQGKCAVYIEKIHGDYNNVVGLPISRVHQEVKKYFPYVYEQYLHS